MRNILKVWTILLLVAVFTTGTSWAGEEAKRVREATRILSTVMTGPEGAAPRYILSHARAVILIPGVKKAGFLVGIKRGKGVIVARGKDGRWLPPSFITLSGGSFGFQAGAKSSDVIILLMSDRALSRFTGNRIKIGVDLGVVAGPIGGKVGISQEDLRKVEAFSYVREKGIFAGAILSGSVLSHDENANRNFYGTCVTFQDILQGKPLPLPPAARELLETLEKFSR